MAKSTNGLGQFRGKMGGVVFSVRNGQQVIRNYQPVVANPKSSDQRIQRAKAVLAGKLSHILTAPMIIGMNGGSKAGRRSEFNRVLLDAIESQISVTTGVAKATLMPERLLLSQGDAVHATVPDPSSIVYDSGTLQVGWRATDFAGSLRVILLVSYWNGSEYEWRVYEKVVQASSRSVTVTLPANWQGTGNYGDVFAYAIPIIINEETLRLNGTPLVSSDEPDTSKYIAKLVATESSAISYAESEYLGTSDLNF